MNPILNQIGTVFIPVRDIEVARDWYSDLLSIPVTGEISFGHLYALPMIGTGIVLDSKIFSEDRIFRVPPFHFNTTNIIEAYEYMKGRVECTTGIIHDRWFNFKDPDGNQLKISQHRDYLKGKRPNSR
ncbi:VOC family protein [Peribacillus sp. NPDC097264]|uniref:VOC family protein n=1 Tax=Peribacillus sp. NPDC097264 TaxID=3390616 RepID=UPI003D0699C3